MKYFKRHKKRKRWEEKLREGKGREQNGNKPSPLIKPNKTENKIEEKSQFFDWFLFAYL
jgi:hypothetical protein